MASSELSLDIFERLGIPAAQPIDRLVDRTVEQDLGIGIEKTNRSIHVLTIVRR
ncbi:hypothetical protein [Rosistilla carotiformis]|uniref:hypothetical protein n=1 Tax=Rosistilla carotiformis TaxID=2528017 RepID=UPI0018D24EFC|nr:hypothetical protein [Rosistilla carotiformis]